MSVDGGRPIQTSLTQDEADALQQLAYGAAVLEVGSAYGYSAVVMGRVAEHVFAIDPHSGYGSMPDSLASMRANVAAYALDGEVSIVVAPSEQALTALYKADVRFDLVFIDGDHRAKPVHGAVDLAMKLLRQGGTLACHDFGEETCPGAALDAMWSAGEFLDGTNRLVDTLWVWELG